MIPAGRLFAAPPPVITLQPTNQTVQTGGSATFDVAATSGTTLTYQWYFQSNSIPGAVTNFYTVTNAQATDAGIYYAAVQNAGGTVNSSNAVLTVQNAPILSGANDLYPILVNNFNNGGTLVTNLIIGKVTDLDAGALYGIAVTAVINTNGTWQYSTNSGAAWIAFGSPTASTARLLAANGSSYVRFVPNTNFVGNVLNGITFRAWDRTSGTAGGTANVTVNGGTTAFSASSASSSISILTYNLVFVDTTNDVADGTTTSISALVANKGADGKISLREAITAANNTPNGPGGPDVIDFNITNALAGGAHTITLASALPAITNAVLLDGTSDSDFSVLPVIELNGASAGAGVSGLSVSGNGSTIRGLAINRFSANGLVLSGNSNVVELLWLGIGVDGVTDLGNGQAGVLITGRTNTVGGAYGPGGGALSEFNVIGGNTGAGLLITGTNATGNVVIGNFIGVSPDGQTLLTNAHGVRIESDASTNRIGGTGSGEDNLIAGSTGDGIGVVGTNSTGNAFLGNVIYANGGLAIDLNDDGVTANDLNDGDTGPNRRQNFPVVSSARVNGSSLTVTGSLNSAASATYRIEFFRVSSSKVDPSGYGETESFLGQTTVTTSANNATFNTTINGVVIGAGDKITATATRDLGGGLYGDTSELGQSVTTTNIGTPGFNISALAPVALGSEIRANTTTASDQYWYYWSVRSIAVAADGSFVGVWIDTSGADGNRKGILGQRFDANGNKVGGEFVVNTTRTGDQDDPSIAMDSAGNFIVAWDSTGDGSQTGIFGQRFQANGTPLGGEFLLNTSTFGAQAYPEIAFATNGSFVAAWKGPNPFGPGSSTLAQRFDANATKVGIEILVNAFNGKDQIIDSMDVRPDGSFIVTWGEGGDVFARVFDSNGLPVTAVVQLNTTTAGTQQYSTVRGDGAGNFVAVWSSAGQDGSGDGVYGRRFAADGTPLTGELALTTQTAGDQYGPVLAMDQFGNFIGAWGDANGLDGSGDSTWVQRFTANCTPVGTPQRVNTTTTGFQGWPVISMNRFGRIVVGWEGNGTGDTYGAFLRRCQVNTVSAEGSSNTFTASLNTAPTAPVTLSLSVSDSTEVSLSTSSLDFDSSNWSIPQSVTITGLQDRIVDGDVALTIVTGTAVSSDPAYNGLDPEDIPLTVLDSGVTNAVPVANGQSVSTPEDTAKPITLTGSDADSDPLTFSLVSGPTTGVLSGLNATNGTVTYTPNANFNGGDSFTFRVNDGFTNSAAATVSITVTAVNDAPIAFSQSVTNAEDTALAITLTASDVDGPVTNFTVVASPTQGVLTGSAPNLTYTPSTNYNGPDSFTFRVNDGSLTSAVATVSITVTPVNDAPIAFNQSVTNAEDTATAITLTASDGDGPVTNFTVVTVPTNGTLTGAAPNLTYTPSTNYNGPDSLTFRVNDGSLTSAPATVSITVTPVNDAPIAFSQSVTNAEDTATAITLTAGDGDGPVTNFTVVTVPTNGTLTGTAPNLTYTQSTNYNGPDSLTFRVNDGSLTSAVATVSITVTPVNDAPIANAQSVSTPATTPKPITLTGSDVENDPLTFAIVTSPTNGTISGFNANTGDLTYTPTNGFSGTDSFTFRTNDGDTNSTPATVTITVTPLADIATTQSGPASVTSFTNFVYTVTVTNRGPTAASNVVVSDVLDNKLIFLSASGGGAYAGGTVTWPALANFPSGAATNFTVNVKAPANGSLTSSASSTSATSDPDASNNDGSSASAQVITVVSPLHVDNSSSGANVSALTWSHKITGGSSRILIVGLSVDSPTTTVTSVQFDNSLPLTLIGQTNGPQTKVAMYYLLNPPVGTSPISVTLDAASGIVGGAVLLRGINQANPIAGFAGNHGNSGTASVTVASEAGAIVIDTLAPKAPAAALSAGPGQTTEWDISSTVYSGAGSSAPGAASVTPSWTLTNSAAWTMAAVALNYSPDIADVAATSTGPTNVLAASNLTYAVSITNLGPDAAADVVVNDTLPVGANFVSASGGGTATNGIVTWPTLASFVSGATTNYTVTITATAFETMTNVVWATATTADPDPSNNNGTSTNAQVISTVTPVADVEGLLTGPATSVFVGSNFNYMITVTNLGPSPASSVTVTDNLPANVAYVSAVPSQGSCSQAGGIVNCSLGSLAANSNATITITVLPNSAGLATNGVVITSDATDPATANNTTQLVTVVTDVPPTISQPPQSTAVCPGAAATFSVTTTGNNLFFQWQTNGVNLANGGHFSGVTTSNLAVSAADSSVATGYRCLVSNTGGSVTSSVAALTLLPGQLAVFPVALDFGTAATGTTVQASLTVTNVACGALSGSAAPDGGPFSVATNGSPFTLAGYGATNVTVQFAPLAAGGFTNRVIFTSDGGVSTNTVTGTGAVVPAALFTGTPTNGIVPLTVTFTDNSTGTITNRAWSFGDGATTNTLATSVQHVYTSTGTNTVRLIVSGAVGVSTNTQANLIVVVNPPQLLVNPGSLNFGALTIGQTNSQNFFVINTGGSLLSGTATGTAPYAVTAGSPYSVAPGGTQTVTVAFAPLTSGTFNSIVLFASDGGTSIIPVSGVGVDPGKIVVNPTSLDFGTLATGTISQRVFVVSNSGGTAVTNGTVTVSGGPYGIVAGATFTVPASGATNVTVQFAPVAAGTFTTNVIFATANGGNSTNTVTGTGAIAPDAQFTGAPINGVAPLTVTFTDSSTGAITSRSWSFGDGNTTNTSATSVQHVYSSAGTNTVHLIVTGPVGASTNTRPNYIVVTNIVVDVTPPQLQVATPADYQAFTNAAVTVTGTASDVSGINNVKVNGATASPSGTNWSWLVTLSVGTNAITVIATDDSVALNTTTQLVHAIRLPSSPGTDTNAPIITITFPTNGWTTASNSVDLIGLVIDDVAVASVLATNEGVSSVNAAFGGGNWQANLMPLKLGTNVLHATATDTSTNSASATVIIIRVSPHYVNTTLRVAKATFSFGTTSDTDSFKISGVFNDTGLAANFAQNEIGVMVGCFEQFLPPNSLVNLKFASPVSGSNKLTLLSVSLTKRTFQLAGAGLTLTNDNPFIVGIAPGPLDLGPDYISPPLPVGGAGKATWKYGIQLPVVDQFFLGKSSLATNSFKLSGTINILGKPNLLANLVTFGIGSFEDVLPANGWTRGNGNSYKYVRPAGHVGGVATMLLDLDKGRWKATGKGVDLRFLSTNALTPIQIEIENFAAEYPAQLRGNGTKFSY